MHEKVRGMVWTVTAEESGEKAPLKGVAGGEGAISGKRQKNSVPGVSIGCPRGPEAGVGSAQGSWGAGEVGVGEGQRAQAGRWWKQDLFGNRTGEMGKDDW